MKRKYFYKPFNLRFPFLLLFLPANILLAQNKTVSGFVRKASNQSADGYGVFMFQQITGVNYLLVTNPGGHLEAII